MKFYDREPFDDQKVEAIRVLLTNLASAGKPNDYQVILDDMEVVPRTSDVSQFVSFYDLIGPKTQNLVINVFSGATRHKRTHAFYFSDTRQGGTLNGVDTQKTVDEQVARFTLEFQNKVLTEQVKELKDELVTIEAENEQVKAENTELREDLKKATGENGIASSIMGGVERLFTHYMPKPNQQPLSGPGQPPPGSIILPLEEYDRFKSFGAIADRFEPHEFDKVFSILKFLAANKPAIDETLDFITEDENPNHDATKENHD